MYIIELVWNREFNWLYYTSKDTFEQAKKTAIELINSGDGMRVKKARVLDENHKQIFQC